MVLIRLAHAADLPTLDEALKSLTSQGQGGQTVSRPAPALPSNGGPAPPPAAGSSTCQHGIARLDGERFRRRAGDAAGRAGSGARNPCFRSAACRISAPRFRSATSPTSRRWPSRTAISCSRSISRPTSGRSASSRAVPVGLTDSAPKTLLGDLTTRLKSWTGRNWLVSVVKDVGGPTLAEAETPSAKRRFSMLAPIRLWQRYWRAFPAPRSSMCAFPTRRK